MELFVAFFQDDVVISDQPEPTLWYFTSKSSCEMRCSCMQITSIPYSIADAISSGICDSPLRVRTLNVDIRVVFFPLNNGVVGTVGTVGGSVATEMVNIWSIFSYKTVFAA